MQSNKVKKSLVVLIIFLFIGVGVQPAFANEISINRPSENKEDCGCQVADNFDIVRIKSLLNRSERFLNRVEIFTRLIPILSKNNPKVIKDCEELSEKITTFIEKNEGLNPNWDFPVICGFLADLGTLFYNIKENIFFPIFEKIEEYSLLWWLMYPIVCFFAVIDFIFIFLVIELNCIEFPPW